MQETMLNLKILQKLENNNIIHKEQIDKLVHLINKCYGKKYFAQQIRRFMQVSLFNYLRAEDTNIDAEDISESWYLITDLVETIDPILEK
ncbi:hypothetical protein [Ornithobacterium rhinotracheale]